MTDRDRLLELLRDFGITPDVVQSEGGVSVDLWGAVGGVEGYRDSSCQFAFDADGKFKEVACWTV